MKLLDLWFDNLMKTPSLALQASCSARGEYNRLGDPPWFAAVRLTIAPGDTLQVESTLDPSLVETLRRQGLYDQILFGVLDVMLTYPSGPIRNFKLTIEEIELDPVKTTLRALRLAARDAVSKIVSEARGYPASKSSFS